MQANSESELPELQRRGRILQAKSKGSSSQSFLEDIGSFFGFSGDCYHDQEGEVA